jgi:hypothetical protein
MMKVEMGRLLFKAKLRTTLVGPFSKNKQEVVIYAYNLAMWEIGRRISV